MASKANQIVSDLLEDHMGAEPSRPGGKDDPWRQGGFAKFNHKKFAATGKRPGENSPAPGPEDEEEEEESPAPKPSRWSWKPNS